MGTMWRKACVVLLTMLLASTAAASGRKATEQRVLFVGNSLTYVNSLPVVFELTAQAQAESPRFRADMYVRGGAKLSELEQEPALRKLLDSGAYQVVVLQERGGDVLCLRDGSETNEAARKACEQMTAAHLNLARRAREHGARVIYMGTYQSNPRFSAMLIDAESELGKQMDAPALEVSETLRRLQSRYPDYPWLFTDNAHPGIATTTLMALRVYQALEPGKPLQPYALCTASRLYTTKLGERAFVSHDQLTAAAGPVRCMLNELQTRSIIDDLSTATD